MDLEPGRCRRTDGRKWRCSKSVVPYQKYCERHMHRGRQGSRKHVEATGSVSKPGFKLSNNNPTSMISYVASAMDTRFAVYDKSEVKLTKQCCSNRNGVNCRSNEDHTASVDIHKEVNKNANVGCVIASLGVTSIDSGALKGVSSGESKKSAFENVNSTKIRRKQSATKSKYLDFLPPRFGSSPKSVLHLSAGKVSPSLVTKNVSETENQRCRRTDGKKWQCRQDAVHGQKYCEAHMHRGAKRLVPNPESVVFKDAPATTSHVSSSISTRLDNGINLNAVPASPCDNSSSSPSDATTITDENISFCLIHQCTSAESMGRL